MNHDPLSDHDLDLLAKTRHAASRHLDITSTPRDTMAVLRQAAEQPSTPALFFPVWAKWAFAALVAGVVLLGVQQMRTPSMQTATLTEAAQTPIIDPGIDLAVWNVEIETLMTEIDASLDDLLNEDSDLNTMANGLLNQEGNWL